ncbi:MAG: SoxR reducing system RseC family protein [Treponema sp.]|jgi:positive regulator of sigma E activity|nr:SoxR reducing system RseC family protein [Treponema sp.]
MIGRVHAVTGGKVLIAPAEKAACFGCLKDCHRGVLVTAENRDTLSLEPGQMVETENSPQGLLFQGLSTLLPPVLGFITGYALIQVLFPAAGEGARAAGGAFLLFAAGAVTFLIRRRYPAKETSRVKRVITGAAILQYKPR